MTAKIVLIIIGTITLITLATFVVQKNYKLPVSNSPVPEATQRITRVPDNWKVYSDSKFGYSVRYPSEYDLGNNGKNSISLQKRANDLGAGPLNFIFINVIPEGFQSLGGEIYNYNTKEANILLGMKQGETKSLREGENIPQVVNAFKYTRLPDTTISGHAAMTFFSPTPWEFPKGVKEYRYFIQTNENLYMIGGYVEGTDFPKEYYISESEFNQIISTLIIKN